MKKLIQTAAALLRVLPFCALFLGFTSRAIAADEVYRPRITPQTKFLKKKVDFSTVEKNPVSEGIFAFQEYNRKYGYSSYFGFYTIDGKCLFEPRYEMADERPVFDNGATVVRDQKNAQGFKPLMILYADGSARELPQSYKSVSQFRDGVATVSTGGLGTKVSEYFCIDTQGRRIWSSLGPGDILEVGYLRDGLRRVKVRTEPSRFRYVTRCGFIDNNGKWAIPPTFKDVREFSNGYALVITEDDRTQFIDTRGNVAYQFPETGWSMSSTIQITDVANGYFMRRMGYEDYRFFNLKGECVGQYANACGFTDGYAFVQDETDESIYVINTDFQPVHTIWGVNLQSSNALLGPNNPVFGNAHLGTIDFRNVVTNNGTPVIMGQRWPNQIGNFNPGAYAPCSSTFTDRTTGEEYEYTGYINEKGEYMVVFCDKEEGGYYRENPVNPPDTLRRGIIRPPHPLPPVDTIPKGPTKVAAAKYTVTVVASPEEGGNVVGGGKYSYGDTVIVGARANKGWIITDIASDNIFSKTRVINEFMVRGDMTITVYFQKEDSVGTMRDGIYSGAKAGFTVQGIEAKNFESIPIYLETSASPLSSAPFGGDTRGILALMLNPDETFTFEGMKNGKPNGIITLNAFCVPFKVLGQSEENGRKYLRLDGGSLKINNVRAVKSGAQASDVAVLEAMMVNLMLMFDSPTAEISPGAYRVEMNDIDDKTGDFTFGMLQRFHPRLGWIAAGSEEFRNVHRGFFVTKVDYGFPADYFNGIRMEPSQKRNDVLWTPTPGFFEGNQSILEDFAARLGETYRRWQSEYDILKDVDMNAINSTYDTLIGK